MKQILSTIQFFAPLLPKSSLNAPHLLKESKRYYMHLFSIFKTNF